MPSVSTNTLIKPLEWLLGRWTSISAKVWLPTLKNPFSYKEILTFSEFGQPFLGYHMITWNPETKAYMHVEGGHLHLAPDNKVTLLTSQNFGICTIEEGSVNNRSLSVASTLISYAKFAKGKVTRIERLYSINNKGQLIFLMRMETEKVPLSVHLEAVYKKES